MNRRRSQRWPPSPCLRWRALLPSPACGRGVGGEGAFAFLKFPEATKRFRALAGARVTFSLRGQRESNQRERPPRLALAGHPARQVREAWPGFSSGLGQPLLRCLNSGIHAVACPREKASPSMASPAARPGRPRLTAAQGPHKSRRASCAPEATATAGHCGLAVRRLPPPRAGEGWGGVLLLLRAGSALLYPGPLWRGGRVEESPQDGRQEAGQFFAGTWTCRRKNPEPARAPAGQDARRARHRGAPLFGYFLSGMREKVTRAPTGARNRFVLAINRHCACSRPSRTGCAPTIAGARGHLRIQRG